MANGYIAKRNATRDAWRKASEDTERQFMVDLFCLALNDPDIMGKDVLGYKRLLRVV